MSDLIDFKNKISASLGLNEKDLKDFDEAADHDKRCKCELCKKYHLIMKGKYKS